MTNNDLLSKIARSELLAKQGVANCTPDEAVARVVALTDLAIVLDRSDLIEITLDWYDAIEGRQDLADVHRVLTNYNRANALAGKRYGTAWQWDQPTLAREMFHLRAAVSSPAFGQMDAVFRCKALNNLGHRFQVAGRLIEALASWNEALNIDEKFGMTLCNRARVLAAYAASIASEDWRTLFLWAAHQSAEAALSSEAHYTDRREMGNRTAAEKLRDEIASTIDIAGVTAAEPLVQGDDAKTPEERSYRDWCLQNFAVLCHANDIGPHRIANADELGLPGHAVPLQAQNKFSAFFDQMKQEFVSARWFAYDGRASAFAHFSDRNVSVSLTEPRTVYALSIEKTKAAFRILYSLFDKIAYFINEYMELGIKERDVTFRRVWRKNDGAIRTEFDDRGNWGFCALFWLAKDFFERDGNDVAEPAAHDLSDLRNHVEHKYFQVIDSGSPTGRLRLDQDVPRLVLTRPDFEAKTIQLLRLARAALIYLSVGVRFEEARREASRAGEDIPILRTLGDLIDEEKL